MLCNLVSIKLLVFCQDHDVCFAPLLKPLSPWSGVVRSWALNFGERFIFRVSNQNWSCSVLKVGPIVKFSFTSLKNHEAYGDHHWKTAFFFHEYLTPVITDTLPETPVHHGHMFYAATCRPIDPASSAQTHTDTTRRSYSSEESQLVAGARTVSIYSLLESRSCYQPRAGFCVLLSVVSFLLFSGAVDSVKCVLPFSFVLLR